MPSLSLPRVFATSAVLFFCVSSLGISIAAFELSPGRAASRLSDVDIGRAVESYVASHPEIVGAAFSKLQRKARDVTDAQRRAALSDFLEDPASRPGVEVVGNPSGKVTLVEFFDYNCGYCRRSIDDLDKLVAGNPDLKVVLTDYPILSAASREAAVVALAAHRQASGRSFYEFHRRLIGHGGQVGRESAMDAARESGFDMDRLAADAADPSLAKAIENNKALAKTLSLTGTPSYIVGGEVVVGAVGADALRVKIESARACGRPIC